MSSSRDPRTTPRPGDILRVETDHFGRYMIREVVHIGRSDIWFKTNGVIQSPCDVRSWQQWAMDSTVTHKAEA